MAIKDVDGLGFQMVALPAAAQSRVGQPEAYAVESATTDCTPNDKAQFQNATAIGKLKACKTAVNELCRLVLFDEDHRALTVITLTTPSG